MIALELEQIAAIVGGRADHRSGGRSAEGAITVTAPAEIDSRAVAQGGLFVAVRGEHVDGHDYAAAAVASGAAAALVERPVDVPHVLVPHTTSALGLLARAVHDRLSDLRTVGLTGSAGKTSTKDLLAHVLEAAGPTIAPVGSFNNELGVPLTVTRADTATAYLVVEMGARGRGHIAELCRISPPQVALVLNVGSAHRGEFGTLDDTAAAKGELVEALDAAGTAVLNADDPRVAAMASRTRGRVLTFGRAATADLRLAEQHVEADGRARVVLAHGGDMVEVVLPLVGQHHGPNAAAAAAVAVCLGLDLATVGERLATAGPRSPHRMARHERADGVVVIDDSYNANPEAVASVLRSVAELTAGRRVAVLGEMLELGDESAERHAEAGQLAAELGFDRVVAVGEAAAPIAGAAGDLGLAVPDVDAAVAALEPWLRDGDVVVVKASRGARLERVVDRLLAPTRHTSD